MIWCLCCCAHGRKYSLFLYASSILLVGQWLVLSSHLWRWDGRWRWLLLFFQRHDDYSQISDWILIQILFLPILICALASLLLLHFQVGARQVWHRGLLHENLCRANMTWMWLLSLCHWSYPSLCIGLHVVGRPCQVAMSLTECNIHLLLWHLE